MLRYVENRQDAQNVPIPKELQPVKSECPVLLTLRHEGKTVARCVHHGAGLTGNVIEAALRAMRSRSLPDRITREYLESLRIELEIMGRVAPIEEERIHDDLRVGLDGLQLTVGVDDPRLKGPHFQDVYQEAVVSPATAYVLGWDAPRMKQQCLTDIRWRPENRSLRRQWNRFATLHYVSYPDNSADGAPTGTWLLYRGKILLPPLSANDCQLRLDIARQVGDFLRRHQESSGLYVLPDVKSSTARQLHAAWAMARLGKTLKDGQAYADSANAVLGCIAKQYVKLDPDDKRANVFTVNPKQEVLATAMFILAAAEDSHNEAGRSVEAKMLAFLRSRMDDQGHFTDAEAKRLDDVSAAVALLAMQTLDPNPADARWRDGVEALLYDAGEMGADEGKRHPLCAEAEAWLGRAILAGQCGGDGQYRNFVTRFVTRILQRQRRGNAPADEIGAICTLTGQAETLPTALAAVLLNQVRESKEISHSREELLQISKAVAAGQSFCRQMLYRPEEAYFTSNPSDWRGGVRHSADAAKVSLDASAGLIEVMLQK
jgi:hypothetical protein